MSKTGAPTHILYLHGFRSSPQSAKAQITLDWLARQHPTVEVACPQLPISPAQAAQCIQATISGWPHQRMAVIGSSLGGYYANWVAYQCGCLSVLLNPAAWPVRDLEKYIGEVTAWHNPQERLDFQPEYISELQALATDPQLEPPAAQLAIIAKGDEVLDWQEMSARYQYAKQIVLEGSDHALSDAYESLLPEIADFLRL